MKKIVVGLLIAICLFSFCSVYATNVAPANVTEVQTNKSKFVQLKETELKELADYNERYGSEAYGWAAFLLNKVRIYSIPLCFLGVAIGAIYQYVIGIRKLDERDKGFGMIISFVTIFGICQILPLVFAIVVKGWRN